MASLMASSSSRRALLLPRNLTSQTVARIASTSRCIARSHPSPSLPRIPLSQSSCSPSALRSFSASPARASEEEVDEHGKKKVIVSGLTTAQETFREFPPPVRHILSDAITDADLEQMDSEFRQTSSFDANDLSREQGRLLQEPRPSKESFWFDEDDPDTITHDVADEFNEDDLTPMAHAKLEEIREQRQYARIIAWEMPLLAKLAKPFKPPTQEQVLRFRYTTYMGEPHPGERKVVVEFSPEDLDLNPAQQLKLKKLAGPRYNPESRIVKMSHDGFDHAAQNKRYLSDMVDKLVAAARDPTDMFEDVPLDLRHHTFKRKPKFPKEWLMTPERRENLDRQRREAAQRDREREVLGQLVDGSERVASYLQGTSPAPASEAPTPLRR